MHACCDIRGVWLSSAIVFSCGVLLMGALDLLYGLWMMTWVNTFIIQPSINWLSQSLLTWIQQLMWLWLASGKNVFLFFCCSGCWVLFSVCADGYKSSEWNVGAISFLWTGFCFWKIIEDEQLFQRVIHLKYLDVRCILKKKEKMFYVLLFQLLDRITFSQKSYLMMGGDIAFFFPIQG